MLHRIVSTNFGLALLFAQSVVLVRSTSKGKALSKVLAELLQARAEDRFRIAGEATTPPATSTIPTYMLQGCDYDGRLYPLNSDIYKGEDRESNWCYGAICDQHGQVLHWDDFNCFPTSTTIEPTTPERTTTTPPPPETTPPLPPGCEYNGQHYAPNSEIYNGEDRGNNWCYGAFCDQEGQVLHWDDFNCFPTTTTPTTTSSITSSSTVSPITPNNNNNNGINNNNNNIGNNNGNSINNWFLKLWNTFFNG